jgi:hypothetical protein
LQSRPHFFARQTTACPDKSEPERRRNENHRRRFDLYQGWASCRSERPRWRYRQFTDVKELLPLRRVHLHARAG